MSKKFEIQQNPGHESESKKFQIHDKKFEITKRTKFEIRDTERVETPTQGWWKQENAYDCGPMAILNILHSINYQGGPETVQQIRDAVALRRVRRGEQTAHRTGDISETGWLTSQDLYQYLRDDLLIPAEILSSAPDIENVKRELSTNPQKFYIIASGSHFRVLKPTENSEEYQLLDSFNNGPELISKAKAFELLDESVGVTGVLAG